MRGRIPAVDLDEFQIEPTVLGLVPRDLCRTFLVIPIQRIADSLVVAMADPKSIEAAGALKRHTRMHIERVIATEAGIRAAIERYYSVRPGTS